MINNFDDKFSDFPNVWPLLHSLLLMPARLFGTQKYLCKYKLSMYLLLKIQAIKTFMAIMGLI